MPEESPKPVKSGFKTTEFWLSLAAAGVAFIVGQGLVTEEQIGNVVSAIGPVVAAFGYTLSRGIAK